MLPFDSQFSFRLWVARKQAALLPGTDDLLTQIDEIERLAAGDAASLSKLADLLVLYDQRASEETRELAAAVQAGKRPPPRHHLWYELACVAHLGLCSRGSAATECLLKTYSERRDDPTGWLLLTLAKVGDPQLEGFFKSLRDEAEKQEVAALGLATIERRLQQAVPEQVNHPATSEFEVIVNALKDENYFRRWRAADTLGRLGDPRAIGPLQKLVDDPNEYVRKAAREAITGISEGHEQTS